MRADQVRDLIGLPLQQYSVGDETVRWRYTVPAVATPSRYHFYAVVMDPKTHRVLDTIVREWNRYSIYESWYNAVAHRL
jgi:hypothetical protein